jgi:hypothetical protein
MTNDLPPDRDADWYDRDVPPEPECPPEPGDGDSLRDARTQRLDLLLQAVPRRGPDDHRSSLLWLTQDVFAAMLDAAETVANPAATDDDLRTATKLLSTMTMKAIGSKPETLASRQLVRALRGAADAIKDGMDPDHAVTLEFELWELRWPGYAAPLSREAKARAVEAWIAGDTSDGVTSKWPAVKLLFQQAGLPAPESLDRLARRWARHD